MRSVTIATLIFLAAMHCSTGAHAAVRIDRLISDLDHPLWTARRDAAQRIADSKDTSGAAIPALIHTLSDVNVEVRRASVQALAAVGAGSELAVRGLVTALDDADWVVRRALTRRPPLQVPARTHAERQR